MTILLPEIIAAARQSRLIGNDIAPDRETQRLPVAEAVRSIALRIRSVSFAAAVPKSDPEDA